MYIRNCCAENYERYFQFHALSGNPTGKLLQTKIGLYSLPKFYWRWNFCSEGTIASQLLTRKGRLRIPNHGITWKHRSLWVGRDAQELPSPTRVAVLVFVIGDREKAWIISHVESRSICKKYSGLLFISTCGGVSVVLQFLQCSLWDSEVFEGQSMTCNL